eukprot:gene8392-217_t
MEDEVVVKLEDKEKNHFKMISLKKTLKWDEVLHKIQSYNKNADGIKFLDSQQDLIHVSSEEEWVIAIEVGINMCYIVEKVPDKENVVEVSEEKKVENPIIVDSKIGETIQIMEEIAEEKETDPIEFQKFLQEGADVITIEEEDKETIDLTHETMELHFEPSEPFIGNEEVSIDSKYSIQNYALFKKDINNLTNQKILSVALEKKKKLSKEGFKETLIQETKTKNFYKFIHEYQPKDVKRSASDEEIYKLFIKCERFIPSLHGIKLEVKRKLEEKSLNYKPQQIEAARIMREKECIQLMKIGGNVDVFHKEAVENATQKLKLYFNLQKQQNSQPPPKQQNNEIEEKIVIVPSNENLFLMKDEPKEKKKKIETSSNIDDNQMVIEKIELKKDRKNKKTTLCSYESSGFCRYVNIKHAKNICEYQHSFKRPYGKFSLFALSSSVHTTVLNSFTKTFPGAKVHQIQGIQNDVLFKLYKQKEKEIANSRGKLNARNLFHGTNSSIMNNIYKSGFILPSDFEGGTTCKYSQVGKPSLCLKNCKHCSNTSQHQWNNCHMYGLGLYFADKAVKSDKYVNGFKDKKKMLVCKVILGNEFMIDRDLKKNDEFHDLVIPPRGFDSIYAKGRKGATNGLGVVNNEFVIFNAYQVYPMYEIEYS